MRETSFLLGGLNVKRCKTTYGEHPWKSGAKPRHVRHPLKIYKMC